jgi:hypothetical protein
VSKPTMSPRGTRACGSLAGSPGGFALELVRLGARAPRLLAERPPGHGSPHVRVISRVPATSPPVPRGDANTAMSHRRAVAALVAHAQVPAAVDVVVIEVPLLPPA